MARPKRTAKPGRAKQPAPVEAEASEAHLVDDPSGATVDGGRDDEGRIDLADAEVAEFGDGDVSNVELELDADPALPEQLAPRRNAGGAVDLYDPLQAYMRDVQRYPLLKPGEQHRLAVEYHDHGNLDAARALVTANLRLVVKIAYEYRRAYRNLLDLVQEGNIGLMQAVSKFDPYRGVKLSSYAAWWIRAYILRFVLNNWRLVKLGTTQAQRKLFFNLQKEKNRLAALGIEATPERIAARLDVTQDEVVSMDRRLTSGEMSLDAPVSTSDGRSTSRIELMPGGNRQVDEVLAEEQLSDLLRDKVGVFGETLKGKEAIIFRRRLVADEPETLQDLGQEFGVSRERVRQLEQRLLRKLRDYLHQEVGTGVFEAQAQQTVPQR